MCSSDLEEAALAEEEEMPLLRRSGARRTASQTYLEELASKWGRRDEDDVPIAHLRRREPSPSAGGGAAMAVEDEGAAQVAEEEAALTKQSFLEEAGLLCFLFGARPFFI